jgi:hypothetical protein
MYCTALDWTNVTMSPPSQINASRSLYLWLLIAPLFLVWIFFLGHRLLDATFHERSDTAVPPYALAVDGVPAPHFESGPDPILSLHLDDKLTMLLRPSEPVKAPVSLRAFRGRNGQLRRWSVSFEPLNNGGFLLRTRTRELPEIDRGAWDLAFLIGLPEALPENPHELPDGSGGPGWQVVRVHLDVRGDTAVPSTLGGYVKSSAQPTYVEDASPVRILRDHIRLALGEHQMPPLPTELLMLQNHHRDACWQLLKLWVLQRPDLRERAAVLNLLDEIARKLDIVEEKIDPTVRSAPNSDSRSPSGGGHISRSGDPEQSDSHTRGAPATDARRNLQSARGGVSQSYDPEKLEPGTRSA